MAVISRRIRELLVGCGMLFLALLIIAKLDMQQAIQSSGPFTIVDGDTLAEGGQRFRLRGIDAPEIGQICARPSGTYDCGLIARAGLMRLIEGRAITCSGRAGDKDRYGRALVSCRSGDLDLGLQMVSAGLAVSDGDYQMTELKARSAGLGIWAGSFERPQEWRRRQRLEDSQLRGWLQTLLIAPLGEWLGWETE